MGKEKMIPGPFYIPEDDGLTGDRKFTYTSSMLTTTTYNLDSEIHHVETGVKNEAQTRSREGKLISAPAHLEPVKTYRKAGLGCVWCVTCHSSLSYDLGACRQCVIPNDRMLNKARLAAHTNPYRDSIFDGQPLPSCDRLLRNYLEEFEYNQTLSYNDKMKADNATWEKSSNTSDHIFGVDVRLVPASYKHYVRQVQGDRGLAKSEARCERRANAELREIAALPNPKWHKPVRSNRGQILVKSQDLMRMVH